MDTCHSTHDPEDVLLGDRSQTQGRTLGSHPQAVRSQTLGDGTRWSPGLGEGRV